MLFTLCMAQSPCLVTEGNYIWWYLDTVALSQETGSVSAVAIETQQQKGSPFSILTRNLSIQSYSANPILKVVHLMKSISSRDGWTDYRLQCNLFWF